LKYTDRIEDSRRDRAFALLSKMEEEYENKNTAFFNKIMKEESALVIRVHAVTVLSEIGDKSSIPVLGDAMKNDPSSLIRHECAFSLGQMGIKDAVPYLIEAALNDPSEIVRHESAAALGAIGDESARMALEKVAKDVSEEVRGSALASLFNLDFLRQDIQEKMNAGLLSKRIERKKNETSKEKRRMPHP
jgi:HEAT repeat protein